MATLNLNELVRERAQTVAEMRRTHETAEREGWGKEAEERWAKAETRVSELETQIANATKQERLTKLETEIGRVTRSAPAPLSSGSVGGSPREVRAKVTASDEYRDAFWTYLRTGNRDAVRNELRTTGPLLTGDSNVPVPTDMDRRIVELLYAPDTMRGVCNVVNIDSDRTIPLESAIPAGALVAENGAITAEQFDYATQITVAPYKFVVASSVSTEYLEDAAIAGGGQDYMIRRHAVAIGTLQESYYTIGSGSSQPKGLVEWADDTNTQVTLANGNVTDIDDFDGDDIIDCYFNVPAQYRSGPKQRFVMNDTTLKFIRKIKTGTGMVDYLWKPSERASDIRDGIPGTIFGVPYVVNAAMPAYAASKKILVFGNFEYATIFDRGQTTMLVDPYSAAANALVKIYMTRRSDFAVLNTAAFSDVRCSAA